MNTHDIELPPLPTWAELDNKYKDGQALTALEQLILFEGYEADFHKHLRPALIEVIRAAIEADRKRQGEVVVTKDDTGNIVAVTRQDDEGRILSVIAEADSKRRGEPVAMSNDKMRAEFDSWIEQQGMSTMKDGETYYHHATHVAWQAWKASHDALLAAAVRKAEPVAWLYEDELPDNYPYEAMFAYRIIE